MNLSRRGFLAGTAAGTAGLVISFYVPIKVARAAPKPAAPPLPAPNAFLRIGKDDSVTVILAHSEMGQGIWTGLAMMIAEELDCAWSKVRCEHAPAAPAYAHTLFGFQATTGSFSTMTEFDRYRNVGATAKVLLVQAAATRWKTTPAKISAANGILSFGSKTLTYGAVADDAMKLALPKTVKLKDPRNWKLLGTKVRRLDTPEKITGKAQYGLDITFPGLRTAVVLRPPAFGAKLVNFDATDALAIDGVEKVVKSANGVAVIARDFWAAKLGRDALRAEWSTPEGGGVNTKTLLAEFRALAGKEGLVVTDDGKVKETIASAASQLDVWFETPYLAHAAMEPLNCTVKLDGDRCEIWTGTQFQGPDQAAAAKFQIAPLRGDRAPAPLSEAGGDALWSEMPPVRVMHIMSSPVVTFFEEQTIPLVEDVMHYKHVRHLPVVDDQRRLVGLVSHRDLLRAQISTMTGLTEDQRRAREEAVLVRQVMTRDVWTVTPDTLASAAGATLLDHAFGCLPVVDELHRLVGIVTEHDFLKLALEALRASDL